MRGFEHGTFHALDHGLRGLMNLVADDGFTDCEIQGAVWDVLSEAQDRIAEIRRCAEKRRR